MNYEMILKKLAEYIMIDQNKGTRFFYCEDDLFGNLFNQLKLISKL